MSFTSNFLIALGLSADAFAVSVARGAAAPGVNMMIALRTGVVFGLVEAGMVFMGWFLGSSFASLISDIDHWVALLLLGAVGGHMIYEGTHSNPDKASADVTNQRRWKTWVAAIGTSIDGAAIGVTFAFISVNIWTAVAIIAGVSFCISALGAMIGPRVGAFIGRRAEIMGGTVLLCIGLSIFYSHMQGILWGT